MTKVELEKELYGKGDFVLIDNITRFLKQQSLPVDTKKFLYKKLIEIYKRRNMFSEVAILYCKLAEFATTFSEKMENYIWEAENYIKAGNFESADIAIKKAITEASPSEKNAILFNLKKFYQNQANTYEIERRRSSALKTYEKMYRMSIFKSEKKDIEKKLLQLYKDFGMIREFMGMKEKLEKEAV